MNSSVGGRLWRCGAFVAWLPLAAVASAAASASPGAEIVGDTLVIEGTPEDDRIVIRATRQPDAVRVILDGQGLGPFGPVARVAVRAGDGDDTVLVSAAVGLPVRIDAGPGDDRLRGGAGPDLVFGEDGDDVLFTSLGRDALDGGPGSNRLVVRPMGEIQVGSSAAGDALRILAQAYDLPPLVADPAATAPGPIVVGPAELLDDEVVEKLRTAYQAGHAIALTGAEAEHAETLRGLLGHASGAGWSEDIPQADLVAFRSAIRPDGGTHESTSILLPRVEEEPPPPAEARLGGREADMLIVEALSQVFSGTPVLADTSICTGVSPEQCLQTLANSYLSQTMAQNNSASLQITNTAYNARSFQNGLDLYYVFQEVDYTAFAGGFVIEWGTTSDNLFGQPSLLGTPKLLKPSPETTLETTTVTSSIGQSYSGSTGYNEMQGLNATLSGGVTVQNSTSITVPPVIITFTETPNPDAAAKWTKGVTGFATEAVTTIIFYNQWIWEVPFDLYAAGQTDTAFLTEATFVPLITVLQATLHSALPLPFGDTFALQQPVVTSADPDDLCPGDRFTITGTGLYPTLVQKVLIDGTAASFSPVSDTEITAVVPSGFEVDFALPVVVQTGEGQSNDDVTIAILCDAVGESSAPAPVDARSAAVGTDP